MNKRHVFAGELVEADYLLGGFDQTNSSFLGQIINLLLQIRPQLLHQFEGIHVFRSSGFHVSKAPLKGHKNKVSKCSSPGAVGQGLPSPLCSAELRCRVALVYAFLKQSQTNTTLVYIHNDQKS